MSKTITVKPIPFAAAILSAVLCSWTAASSMANAADPATYQWVDDNGTISFSDNPARVPAHYGKKLVIRESVKGKMLQSQSKQAHGPELKPTRRKAIYGGHDEAWWRGQYSGTRSEIERINTALGVKQQDLKTLHYKKVVSNSSQTDGIFGNPRENRDTYQEALEEIQRDEQRIKALEQKLAELENEAARQGAPLQWRQ